jgi:hypothetical protein
MYCSSETGTIIVSIYHPRPRNRLIDTKTTTVLLCGKSGLLPGAKSSTLAPASIFT